MTEPAPPRASRDRVVGAFIDLYVAAVLGPMLLGTLAALLTGVLTEDLRITMFTLLATIAGLVAWTGRKTLGEPVRLVLFVAAMLLTSVTDIVMVGVLSPGPVLGGMIASVVAAATSGRRAGLVVAAVSWLLYTALGLLVFQGALVPNPTSLANGLTLPGWGAQALAFGFAIAVLAYGTGWLNEVLVAARRAAEKRARESEETAADLARTLDALRASEERLRASEARLRALIQRLPDVLLRVDADGVIREAHIPEHAPSILPMEAFARRGGLEGRALDVLPIPTTELSRVTGALREALAGHFPATILSESEGTADPSTRRHLEIRVTPSDGDEVLLSIRDTTERRQIEEHLRHSERIESLGRLSGSIAHDFGNILTGILAFGEVLSLRLADRPDLAAQARQIVVAGERAASLTRRLRTLSRRSSEPYRDVDVHVLVQEAVQLFERSRAQGQRSTPLLRVEVSLAAPISTTQGDAAALVSVTLNLLLNARDAMPDGGMISVRSTNTRFDTAESTALGLGGRRGDWLVVTVADTGLGMTPATLRKVFEPFFTTKSASTGTGLGLSIALTTVREHGGALTASSVVGRGSVFNLILPVEAVKVVDKEPVTEVQLQGCRVLLVDDDPLALAATRTLLQHVGCTVTAATNGGEGLRMWRANPDNIDVVVLDVLMPDMDGREVARQMLEERPDSRVLLLSGFAPETETPVLGLAGVLQKPCLRADLTEALGRALAGRSKR